MELVQAELFNKAVNLINFPLKLHKMNLRLRTVYYTKLNICYP